MLPGGERESAGAAGWVIHALARIGVDHRHHGVDQRAGCIFRLYLNKAYRGVTSIHLLLP
jgi:hypothetical protein